MVTYIVRSMHRAHKIVFNSEGMTVSTFTLKYRQLLLASRSASQPNLSPRGRASQGFARHPSKLVARPCSPWPEPNYQPESDDEDRDVEQGLVDSANPDAGVRSQGEDSVENLACHASLAQVFNQEPGLQDKLLAVLQQEASNDDELLKLQVRLQSGITAAKCRINLRIVCSWR